MKQFCLQMLISFFAALCCYTNVFAAGHSFSGTIDTVQPKMVKIYGAGGLRGLEAYQSGFLISNEGHVLTVWSYVLDTDEVTAVLDDGRRLSSEMVGFDPRLEIAVLKVDVADVDHFARNEPAVLQPGSRVLAFSNLYGVANGDEPTSVLHGSVSAITTLSARRGAYQSLYTGPIYIVDAMTNNAGAAGGALTDRRGNLAGLLGKELRNTENNIWLNYSIPLSELNQAIDDILAGKVRPRGDDTGRKKPEQPVSMDDLGIVLLPNILNRTPPFIQYVQPNSPAAEAGIKADDLILYVDTTVVQTRSELLEEISYIDKLDVVRLTVQRGQKLVAFEIIAAGSK
ncbi:MAG: trypsin-like peptidase domain-containing protein [Planctomycetales bacterium]|nr:trypsin-like peptidase domain-containing protein [Planctomycetales bacterium]